MAILVWRKDIERKSKLMAATIMQQDRVDDVLFCPVLQGAIPFFNTMVESFAFFDEDYVRGMSVEYVGVRSYNGTSRGTHTFYKTVDPALFKNKVVWLFDDIADTGATFKFLEGFFLLNGAAAMKTCALLKRNTCEYPVTLHGFQLQDEWVYGYGMDQPDGTGRAIPQIEY